MDLYYVMTNYQLLECLLHRMTLNKDNKATILLSSFLAFHNPNLTRNLKKSNIFDDVGVYEETIFSHEEGINLQSEVESIRDAVEIGYGELIKKCNNIYIGQDVNSLGLYLVLKRIKYYYLEDASGSFSNPEVLLGVIKDENINRYNIIHKLQLGGRSECVINVYCDFERQKKRFDSSKCIDFSVKKILEGLSEKDLNRILKIYNCRKYHLENKKKDLLLTWQYSNMLFMTLDEQKEFFSLLVDYFKGENDLLFIKPHPSDKQPNYRKWFKDAIVFDRLMPSELLPFCIDDKFERGITNWSTSVYGLQEVLKDVVNFKKDIDKTYHDFNKYFAVVKYLDRIKDEGSIQGIILKGVNERQLFQLLRYYIKNYEKYYEFVEEGEGIFIVDRYENGLEEKKCIIMGGCDGFSPQDALELSVGDRKEYIFLHNLRCGNIEVEKEMKYSGYKLKIVNRGIGWYIDNRNKLIGERDETIEELEEKNKELKDDLKETKKKLTYHKNEAKNLRNSTSWKVTKPLRKISSIRKKE